MRVEKLHAERRLSERDVRRAYGGAFLAFYACLERSIERLFLGTVMGRYTYTNGSVRALVSIKSERVARLAVQGGRDYVDWLPYDLTVRRATAFLSTGRPFSDLTPAQQKTFARVATVRNAIAHESNSSHKRFHRELVAGTALPVSQQTPAGYLRGQHGAGQTRFSHLLADAVITFGALCT
jgi:hypothetical protein